MKILATILLLFAAVLVHGQYTDTSVFDNENDVFTQEKYYKADQSSPITYLLEYRFGINKTFAASADSLHTGAGHFHVPAYITVTVFRGNRQTELGTVKGIFSSTQCAEKSGSRDLPEVWVRQAEALYTNKRKP